MDQHLHGLFARALDDEPLPPPADLARSAMAHGTTLRRRRQWRNGGIAGGVVVAALLTLNLAAPAGDSVSSAEPAALPVPGASRCVAQTDVAVFLRPDITTDQRTALEAALGGDHRIRWYSFESREQAFENFAKLWRDSPEFLKSVNATQLPEAFRVGLSSASDYRTFATEMRRRPGVGDVTPDGCRTTTGQGGTATGPDGTATGPGGTTTGPGGTTTGPGGTAGASAGATAGVSR